VDWLFSGHERVCVPDRVPGLGRLRQYPRGWLPNDLVAGLVLTAFLVPVGMGYAQAAGLPPITGLYATIVPLVAYAIFGPSRVMVLGPDSSMPGTALASIWHACVNDGGKLTPRAQLTAPFNSL
jgi:MFS superfamily sulfate permease-like transporter